MFKDPIATTLNPDQPATPTPPTEQSHVKARRVQGHPTPDPTENILIVDSAADQSCVGQGFRILHYTGASIQLEGALDTMGGGYYPLVSAAAVVTDPTTTREIIIVVNQAAYNPSLSQHESLLHTDQARNHGVFVNDLATYYADRYGNPGLQNLEADGYTIPLKHDGLKYFLHVREPTDVEWQSLPLVELTSPMEWYGCHHHIPKNSRSGVAVSAIYPRTFYIRSNIPPKSSTP